MAFLGLATDDTLSHSLWLFVIGTSIHAIIVSFHSTSVLKNGSFLFIYVQCYVSGMLQFHRNVLALTEVFL